MSDDICALPARSETLAEQEFLGDQLWAETVRLFDVRNRQLGGVRDQTAHGIANLAALYLREGARWKQFLRDRGVEGPRRGLRPRSPFHTVCRYLIGRGVGGDKTGEAVIISSVLDAWHDQRDTLIPDEIPPWIKRQGGIRKIYEGGNDAARQRTERDHYYGDRETHTDWQTRYDRPSRPAGPATASERHSRSPTAHLHLDDCLDVMADIPKHSIDLIVADLPYGTRTRYAWDVVPDLPRLWSHYRRILKPYRPILLFVNQLLASKLVNSAEDQFKYDMIWVKSRAADFVHAKNRPRRYHESILVFSEGAIAAASYSPRRMPYYPQQIADRDRYPRSVIDNLADLPNEPVTILDGFSMPKEERGCHPMQKPVSLLQFLIEMYSRPGEVVLDSHMGSGTTGVAALGMGRNFVGIEIEKTTFDIARQRVAQATQTIPGSLNAKLTGDTHLE